MGGIRTDLWGGNAVPGDYAAGEVSGTGVHGANRLASNFFFFNDTAATGIYTLSLHDALPISGLPERLDGALALEPAEYGVERAAAHRGQRSEEHTSELQSRSELVCRLVR